MSRHNLRTPAWPDEGRDSESCRLITAIVVAEWAELFLACAGFFMLARAMELLG